VGIGGTTRDEKAQEEMVTGDTETAMGTGRVQRNLQKRQICIYINKQIMGARGASELCTLIEPRAAEFNQVVELV